MNSLGLTWIHLVSFGFTWIHLESFGITWNHLDSRDFTLIYVDFISFHLVYFDFILFRLMSLEFTLFHLIPQGTRERPVGQKGKGKGAVSRFGAWISLGIQTARARTHHTKRFPGWNHPPTSDIYIYIYRHIYIYIYITILTTIYKTGHTYMTGVSNGSCQYCHSNSS